MRRALLTMLLLGAVVGIGALAPSAGAAPSSAGLEGPNASAGAGESGSVAIGTAIQITRGDPTVRGPEVRDGLTVQLVRAEKVATRGGSSEGAANPATASETSRQPVLIAVLVGGLAVLAVAGLVHALRRRSLREASAT